MMGAGIISGWQSLVFAQPPPGEDVGPLVSRAGRPAVTRGRPGLCDTWPAGSVAGPGADILSSNKHQSIFWNIPNDNRTHSNVLLILPHFLWSFTRKWAEYFPLVTEGSWDTEGLSACEGRAGLTPVSWAPEHIWTFPQLCCELTLSISMKPGPDHTLVMTLNTLDTTQTFQYKVTGHLCWHPRVLFLLFPDFLRYRSILWRQKRQHNKRFTHSSRHDVYKLLSSEFGPGPTRLILEPFCCDYRSSVT